MSLDLKPSGAKQARFLIPVEGQWCISKAGDWISQHQQYCTSDFLLVRVMTPAWFDEIPHTSGQALQLLNKQEELTAERQRELTALAQRLQDKYPQAKISVLVTADRFPAEQIAELAATWQADSILIFRRPGGMLQRLFGNGLTEQIIRLAQCTVQVVKEPERAPLQQPRTARQTA